MTLRHWWGRARWRLYAPIYDLVSKPLNHGREQAIDQLHLEGGDHVLILGGGPGVDLEYLPAGVSVTAVDIVPAMVQRTVARATDLDIDVAAQVGDAQAVALQDDTFDAVLLHLVLSVVPNPQAVVEETARVLAPGGAVSIFDKFVPPGEEPSFARRTINPVTRLLFSDLTRRLDPLFVDTGLAINRRERLLGGLYTIAIAQPTDAK